MYVAHAHLGERAVQTFQLRRRRRPRRRRLMFQTF